MRRVAIVRTRPSQPSTINNAGQGEDMAAIGSTASRFADEREEAAFRRNCRKLLAAGLIGSSLEWYDFFIYATAAALVFGELFFPNASPLMGTLLAFSTFWAGFIARPIGGLIFGHVGDKIGRKPALVTCLLLMGTATFVKIGRASCRE